jgi:hypothetical protein
MLTIVFVCAVEADHGGPSGKVSTHSPIFLDVRLRLSKACDGVVFNIESRTYCLESHLEGLYSRVAVVTVALRHEGQRRTTCIFTTI